jgi:phosphoribosyl-ATP pyrophosphohydrolase
LNLGAFKFFLISKFLLKKMSKNQFSLEQLFAEIKTKIIAKEKNSYTCELVKEGVEKITRKVGEEALEVMIAAFVNERKPSKKSHQDLVGEVGDLFFHTLVLLASQKVELDEVLTELGKRNKKTKVLKNKK